MSNFDMLLGGDYRAVAKGKDIDPQALVKNGQNSSKPMNAGTRYNFCYGLPDCRALGSCVPNTANVGTIA